MNRSAPLHAVLLAALLGVIVVTTPGCALWCILNNLGNDLPMCPRAVSIGLGMDPYMAPGCTITNAESDGWPPSLCGERDVCEAIHENGSFIYRSSDPKSNYRWDTENAERIDEEATDVDICAGGAMLQFVATMADGPSGDRYSEAVQLIPLDDYNLEGRVIRAQVLVNRMAGSQDQEFQLSLRAMSGDPARYREERSDELALSFTPFLSDGDPGTWEAVRTELAVPPTTDYVALEVVAFENISNEVDAPEFAGHFMDYATAVLVSPLGTYDVAVEADLPYGVPDPGQVVRVEFDMRNNGPQGLLPKVTAQLFIGNGLETSGSPSSGDGPYDPETMTWFVEELRTTATLSVPVVVRATSVPGDDYTVRLQLIEGLGLDDDATNNSASVDLMPEYYAPVAVADTFIVGTENLAVSAENGVLANDTDGEGDALTAVLVSPPTEGALTFEPSGAFTYVPPADFTGTTTFRYRASDGEHVSNVAAVRLIAEETDAYDLALTVTGSPSTVGPSSPATFTVQVRNDGPGAASDVGVLNDLPDYGTTVQSIQTSQGSYDAETGDWTVGELAPGASATLTITALIHVTVINTATITGGLDGDTDPTNDSDDATVTVAYGPGE